MNITTSRSFSVGMAVWDDIQQTIIVDKDVWEAYIQENADTFAFGERSLHIYDDLQMIYCFRGSNGRLSGMGVKIENEDNIFKDLHTPDVEFNISDRRKKRKSATSSALAHSIKIQSLIKEETLEAFDQMPDLLGTWAGYKEQHRDYNSIKSIVDALKTISGMDDDELFLEAIQLFEDEKNAKIFIEMDVNQHRKWLLRKLSAGSILF